MMGTEYFNYFSENVDSFLRRKKEWHGFDVLILKIIILKKFDSLFENYSWRRFFNYIQDFLLNFNYLF